MTTATKTATSDNGQLTQADRYRRDVAEELVHATAELEERETIWERLKGETKDAKADVDAAQRQVNRLAKEMRDIQLDQYQPHLLDGQKPHKPVAATNDSANQAVTVPSVAQDQSGPPMTSPVATETADTKWGSDPIGVLAKHGARATDAEKLSNSELDIKTIADFSRVLKSDPIWHKKVKGFGEKAVDRVMDALQRYIEANPVPEASPIPTNAEDAAQSMETEVKSGSSDVETGGPDEQGVEFDYPDRNDPNVPDGEFTAINRPEVKGDGWSVQVAVGLLADQTWRSCLLCSVYGASGGRETPHTDSVPYATQAEAGAAALNELIDAWGSAGGTRKAAVPWLMQFRDSMFHVTDEAVQEPQSESAPEQTPEADAQSPATADSGPPVPQDVAFGG